VTQTCRNYIGGKWVASESKEVHKLTNPATGELLGEVAMSTADEVRSAISAAHKAFPEWRRIPPLSRARYLLRLRDRLEEEFDDFAHIAHAMRLEAAGLSAADAAQHAVAALVKLNEELQVPRLRDCNISREAFEQALPKMAADALASGSPANNPRMPTAEEIIELYRQAY